MFPGEKRGGQEKRSGKAERAARKRMVLEKSLGTCARVRDLGGGRSYLCNLTLFKDPSVGEILYGSFKTKKMGGLYWRKKSRVVIKGETRYGD